MDDTLQLASWPGLYNTDFLQKIKQGNKDEYRAMGCSYKQFGWTL